MFGLKPIESCKPYFQKHKILTLPSLYILETALFVKSNPALFLRLEDVVSRNRRDNSRLRMPSTKTALMAKSILCMAPKIFNKLPLQIRELPLNKFKYWLKMHLTQKCYYDIKEFLNDKIKL